MHASMCDATLYLLGQALHVASGWACAAWRPTLTPRGRAPPRPLPSLHPRLPSHAPPLSASQAELAAALEAAGEDGFKAATAKLSAARASVGAMSAGMLLELHKHKKVTGAAAPLSSMRCCALF